MADNLVTSSYIAAKTLEILHNKSAFLGNIDTSYSEMFNKAGAKAGTSINVKRAVQFMVRDGNVANLQDVNMPTVPLTIQPEFGIDWDFSDFDLTLKVDQFAEQFLMPAGARLASELDFRIAKAVVKATANFSGTPGATPNTALIALTAGVKLDNNACPPGTDRTMAMTPLANATMVSAMTGLFNNQAIIGENFKTGQMSTQLGMDFLMSQNLPTHTVGVATGTPLVNGANQGLINTGTADNPWAATTTIATDGWTVSTTGILKAGDVVTFAGAYEVNPETKQSTGVLRDFVVTADVTSGASTGPCNLIVSPAIIAGGAYQNVTALPADNAAIVVRTGTGGTAYAQNILFHKKAITLATIDMEQPNGVDMVSTKSYKGVSIRFLRDYDPINNRRICRFDVLAGYAVLMPEWVCRLTQ